MSQKMPPAEEKAVPYRVLARKYRPTVFEDLIGQDAMVRTLSNAFDSGRIPQAWMLTGVRGVGKTTTARILARGLNYQREDGTGSPTVHLPEFGIHCQAILESRHIDVMEMDAASHTGIDDVRQITDSVRYAPVHARYKVYIIDEVHMLSDKAFNAFLKTLEEPPSHAKFIFATTEIRKVPVTILSRCQRFDLRRVDSEKIIAHLSRICGEEKVEAEAEALSMLARASEGSVRDSLSLLDQAIAHSAGQISAASIRDMLGLADKAQIVDLFETVMKGDLVAAFEILRSQYDSGADPAILLSDLAAFTHLVTRIKLVPETAKDSALSEAERVRGAQFAEKLSIRALSRTWQILLKGIPEIQASGRPVQAAEMLLVRLAYAADLPTPDEALKLLRDKENLQVLSSPQSSPAGANTPPHSHPSASRQNSTAYGHNQNLALASSSAAPSLAPAVSQEKTLYLRRFSDVIALAAQEREIALKTALERDVHLVSFEEGKIDISLEPQANRSLPNDLAYFLKNATGMRWIVALSRQSGEPTEQQKKAAAQEKLLSDIGSHPVVLAVMQCFPNAKIVNVRQKEELTATPQDELDPDEALMVQEEQEEAQEPDSL